MFLSAHAILASGHLKDGRTSDLLYLRDDIQLNNCNHLIFDLFQVFTLPLIINTAVSRPHGQTLGIHTMGPVLKIPLNLTCC